MFDDIREIFTHRKPDLMGEFRKSSVMLLLKEINGEICICFEVRASTLRHQPGDICLPGGKVEDGETPQAAALRETMEELNLGYEMIEVVGDMDYFVSPYNSIIYGFVGILKIGDFVPNPQEVEHVFWVPLRFFEENEPLCRAVEIKPVIKEDFPFHMIKGGHNYKFHKGSLKQYFYQYENYVIWGFTAMMVKKFIEIIRKEDRHRGF